MAWDISDRQRLTRRSDVAFWLHLLAAPLIIHPTFSMLHMGGPGGMASLFSADEITAARVIGEGSVPLRALGAVMIYVLLSVVALAIDRRAVLVSALIYVIYAVSVLFRASGVVGLNFALTILVIGGVLLLLSAFWHRTRLLVLRPLPAAWRARLPQE